MSKTQLNVLQVIPALDAGGAERTTVDVAIAISKAGGTAWIASQGGRLASEAKKAGAKLVSGDYGTKNPVRMWSNAGALAELIKRENISIVHARSRAPAWSAYIASRNTGAKFVATYHGIYNANNPFKRYYNSIMTKGEAVIANSQFTANHVIAEHKLDPKKIVVIPRGIDIDAFTPANVTPDRIDAIKKQWGLKPGKPVIVLPGRLTRWKGQLDFVEALAKLDVRDFEAVLVGDAQERESYLADLRRAIDEAKLTQKIRIPGHCSDMPAAFMAADIIVAPSIEPEAFGRVAVEAQAMGKPLVASRLGAQTETVDDGKTGYLFEPHDTSAMAAAIANALKMSATERESMARAGRLRVLQNYTVDTMCKSTLTVYAKLMS